MIDRATIPLSPAHRAADPLFLSGQFALDPDSRFGASDIQGQTRHVPQRNIENVPAAHGAMLKDVLNPTIWTADETESPGFNKVHRDSVLMMPPARSTVFSGLGPGAKDEITVVAHLGGGRRLSS